MQNFSLPKQQSTSSQNLNSRVSDALGPSDGMFRQILDAVSDLILVKDADSRIIYANKAFRDFYRMSMEELCGIIDAPFSNPEHTRKYLRDDARVRAGLTVDIDEPVTKHDGTVVPFHTIKSPIRGINGRVAYTVGVSRDVGKQQLHEEQIRALNESLKQKVEELSISNERLRTLATELDRSNRQLEATARDLERASIEANAASELKSCFLAKMSHEIRTPLNAVIGFSDALKRTNLDADQKQFCEYVNLSAEALLSLIDEILDYSKIEAGKVEIESINFPLRPLLEQSVKLISQAAADKGIQLNIKTAPSLPVMVYGDPMRLRQVLLNLLSNALKFTKEGAITVSADISYSRTHSAMLVFEVVDTGIGIEAAKLDTIFQPFAQADSSTTREYGGTGLGLSISANLVHLMGGDIGVHSRPGAGSTFWFWIPLRAVSESESDSSPDNRTGIDATVQALPLVSHPVLVVEDNPVNQRVIMHLLRELNLAVEGVHNGREAVKAVASNTYSLVFMDCQMPEMDGCSASRLIRTMEAKSTKPTHVPIIALTAHATSEDKALALEAGMDDYVTKPINLAKVRNVLLKWLPGPGR